MRLCRVLALPSQLMPVAGYPESVSTDRLWLERLRRSDEDAIVAIWATGDTWSWLRPGTRYDEGLARLGVDRHIRHWDDYGFGLWAVRELSDDAVIGWIGASHPAYVPQFASEIEIGWTLRPKSRGRGLATEGARAARDAAFAALSPARLISLIATRNEPSQGVARALGMHPTTTVRHPQFGETLEVYELLRP